MTSLHLLVPDSHNKRGLSVRRFELVGKLIDDRGPDRLIVGGDWYDMPSLSSYDKGKKSFEGRRYNHDIDAGNTALDVFETNYSHKLKSKDALEGNHEHRIERAVQLSSELEGTISSEDFLWPEYGYNYVPYTGATPGQIVRDGVTYAHYFISGVNGKPIGGENPATALLNKQFTSCVAVHNHLRDFSERTTANGKKISGLVGGCFLEHFEEYAGAANKLWWSGVVLLHVGSDGSFDPEFISLRRLKELYA